MDIVTSTPDRAAVSAAERVGSTLAAAAAVGYSQRDVANVRRSLRRAGKRVTNRQIRAALNLAAWGRLMAADTDERPGHTPAPIRHAAWCSPLEHLAGDEDDARTCYSTPLRLDFGDRGPAVDAVDQAVFSLLRDPEEGVKLNVLGPDFALDPDQFRPLAMGLLAFDALFRGDLDMFAFYRGEAEASASVKR